LVSAALVVPIVDDTPYGRNFNKTDNVRMHATSSRVHATIVAIKSVTCHILWLCVWSLSYPARKADVPYINKSPKWCKLCSL